ncbi:MAG: hypothetical protein DKM50_07745 [Candidatus Margulisiibacteriota bacterium]|nr:MAG: hypothetical protein A2X43_05200 [Candidatus Margulisbacteria bacterium GWD2_39_127]OGI04962.1 MAG: hypothetical protein A2X42_03250 [Candidatus Margulisbacteria bacterium GWF2_38_17]OGI06638.1 MAG: hypothetical protein A2X41_05530 [Candidatus Margulisbacteria bacterium GWE2_39_32]PZM79719.1 MAG: hypothetical protein DKM50_07745 [Candidatus Margulisiibacteriota bacterium]HAR63583.1 hypothetical protein [Candidatus Margulisiibacteriota bacterium]
MKKVLIMFAIILSYMLPAAYAEVLIEKGDTLKVYVFDRRGTDLVLGSFSPNGMAQQLGEEDPHQVNVSSEGKIFIPNIGVLSVSDKSTTEVEKMIIQGLSSSIQLQQVAVLLMTPKFNRVYVLGEVANPGMYKYDQTKPYEGKLMSLISSAGGFTDRANKDAVSIIKENGSMVTINLMQMVRKNSIRENVVLEDKDTIMIGQCISRVYVIGEVRTPGGYQFLEGATFADYIAEAGGINNTAAMDNIGIVRKNKDRNEVFKVALDGTFSTNGQKNTAVYPGDTIYVPKHFFADWKDLGSVLGMARDSIYVYDTVTGRYPR